MTGAFTKANRFSYDGNPRWEIADRTVLNMNEQHVIFMSLVWLHALFVDAPLAGILGLAAAGFRATYPFFRMWRGIAVELSTQPYWVALFGLQANLMFTALGRPPPVDAASLGSARSLGVLLLIWLVSMLGQMPLIVLSCAISKRRLGGLERAPGT